MKKLLICFLLLIAFNSSSQTPWVAASPLQDAYQALLSSNPNLAWQRLTLLLHRADDAELQAQWPKLFDIIVSQSQCGQELPVRLKSNIKLKLIFSRGFTLRFTQYYLKLMLNGVHTDIEVKLEDPKGRIWLVGKAHPNSEKYAEIESQSYRPLPAGPYLLTLNINGQTTKLSLIIPPFEAKRRVIISPQSSGIYYQYWLPKAQNNCPKPYAHWQWFDAQYELREEQVATASQGDQFPPLKNDSDILQLVVGHAIYQGDLELEWQQRTRVPHS